MEINCNNFILAIIHFVQLNYKSTFPADWLEAVMMDHSKEVIYGYYYKHNVTCTQ